MNRLLQDSEVGILREYVSIKFYERFKRIITQEDFNNLYYIVLKSRDSNGLFEFSYESVERWLDELERNNSITH